MLELALDATLAVLILVALGLGLRLQRNLRLLRGGDGELERLIAALDRATLRSEAALQGLKSAAAAADARLAGVERLLDDLRFLTSRGEQLADLLEEQVRHGRPAPRSDPLLAAALSRPRLAPDSAGQAAALERTLSTLR
ncbi:MAG: hypothetical protein K0S35_3573 [Geminicoccaceae bacterium]|jgi:hypothetical protein|nr:hypothetical protein [Geminicoccaceae bacterium]